MAILVIASNFPSPVSHNFPQRNFGVKMQPQLED